MLLSPFIPHSPFLSPPAPCPQGYSFRQPLLRSNGAPFQPRTLICGSHTLLLPPMRHLYPLLPHKDHISGLTTSLQTQSMSGHSSIMPTALTFLFSLAHRH